jgi:hypothetical protein
MKLSDIERQPPCLCGECKQAGVSDLPLRRDPHTGVFLHGYPLKRWYAAREDFRRTARAVVGHKGRHSTMERLATREPGDSD